MANAPKAKNQGPRPDTTGLELRIAGLEKRIADLDPHEALAKLSTQMTEIQTGLLELKAAIPAMRASANTPLTATEVEKILADSPGAKFIALAPYHQKGLRAGDRFEPRQLFRQQSLFISTVKANNLRVCAAA